MPDVVKRLLREPLVHFVVLGAVLFVAISLVRDARRPTVRIDAAEINQLGSYWELQMKRPPTKAELAGIIQDRIDEELLAREAVRLGLDKDDMIVRRRLAQKMSFASEDLAAARKPSERQLRDFYAANAGRYATPARVAMTHVFFSRDRQGRPPEAAAQEALMHARAGEAPVGDPSLLPLAYGDAMIDDLARDYGSAFAEAARTAPLGAWTGPVVSPYGLHLLKVSSRQGAVTPPFEQVRAEVADAWAADQRRLANREALERLRKRYRVVVAGIAP